HATGTRERVRTKNGQKKKTEAGAQRSEAMVPIQRVNENNGCTAKSPGSSHSNGAPLAFFPEASHITTPSPRNKTSHKRKQRRKKKALESSPYFLLAAPSSTTRFCPVTEPARFDSKNVTAD
ncbi:unnamed protein product, partial [Ectocarpus fasciculatus]